MSTENRFGNKVDLSPLKDIQSARREEAKRLREECVRWLFTDNWTITICLDDRWLVKGKLKTVSVQCEGSITKDGGEVLLQHRLQIARGGGECADTRIQFEGEETIQKKVYPKLSNKVQKVW